MSYPSYNSAPYPPQGAPSYQGAPGYQAGYPPPSGPYPPQGPPAPGAAPPQGYQQGYQAGYGQPPQPSYGGYPPAQPPQAGYPHTATPPPGAPGAYAPPYGAASYNQGYQPSRSPQPGHAPAYGQQPGGYASPYPGQAPPSQGYGAPPPQPGYGAPAGYGAPGPQAAYGAPPAAAAPPPGGDRPIKFQFRQDKGFDSSGKIIDEQGKAIFVLKDESDGHGWTKYLKTRPLQLLRSDGSKFAEIDWKGGPDETKVTLHAIWSKGEKAKMRMEGDILDQDWKFRLPNGQAFEWDGPGPEQIFNLLDQQQVSGSGFDTQAKTVARYMMHTEDRDATLEMLPEAMAVPDLLDACILTSFYLEYYVTNDAEENGPSTSGALASAFQNAANN